MNHYGEICKCCGETIFEFLEIDHIDGGGNQHRKEIGSHYYDWIIKNNFPDILQTLCAKCNNGRGKFSVCPHHQEPQQPKSKKAIRQRRQRLKCIAEYGSKCTCCGEDNWAFLEFDHINNDGAEHRKITKNMPRWLIENNFPSTIQLLCSNCNKAKQQYPDWYEKYNIEKGETEVSPLKVINQLAADDITATEHNPTSSKNFLGVE
jgi:hypothetical protein